MKKYIYILLALSLISCGSERTSSITGESGGQIASIQSINAGSDSEQYKGGELLVKFKTGVSQSDSSQIHRAARASVKNTFTIVPGLEQVNLPEGLSVEDAIEQYLSDPNVEYAEPNYLRYASSISPRIPNDTYFARQWSLMNTGIIADGTPGADIQATDAWGINTGSSSVPIAVIDTGIDYDHPDLVGNVWINPLENPNNGIDDDGNGKVDDWRGWDFTTCAAFRSGPPFDCVTPKSEDNDPFDDEGHGTHVSGTVGAVGNNGEGVTGVMWQAQLMALKALNASSMPLTMPLPTEH
jgi:subtilisin family serine protease